MISYAWHPRQENSIEQQTPRAQEGHCPHGHLFVQTDYRVATLTMQQLPKQQYAELLPQGFDTSRVIIVQPDAAAYSGPR